MAKVLEHVTSRDMSGRWRAGPVLIVLSISIGPFVRD